MARFSQSPISNVEGGYSGTALAGFVNELVAAIVSGHYNVDRPEGAAKGLVWSKTVGEEIHVMLFDGTTDHQIATWTDAGGLAINATALEGNDAAFFQNADNLTSGTVDWARLEGSVPLPNITTGAILERRPWDFDTGDAAIAPSGGSWLLTYNLQNMTNQAISAGARVLAAGGQGILVVPANQRLRGWAERVA